MYISRISFKPDGNRSWSMLKDCYEIHKDILSAFPDSKGNAREEFNVLYKIIENKEQIVILVKSDIEPDWGKSRTFKNIKHESKDISAIKDKISDGDILQFNIDVCPAKKIRTQNKNSKRIFLSKREEQIEWLRRKAEQNGFEVFNAGQIDVGERETLYGRKKDIFFYKVNMSGALKVIERDRFINALIKGIGSEKAFGCGLMAVKR